MKAGRGRRTGVQSQAHHGRITDTTAPFLRMYELSFKQKTAKPTTEVLRLCSRSQEKLSRMFFCVLPCLGRKIAFLQKELYYKPTHFEHRFETQFLAESYTCVAICILESRSSFVEPIPFQGHSPGSSSWTPGIAWAWAWAILDSRNSYSFVEPIPFQEHSQGSFSWTPGIIPETLSKKLFLDSRNSLGVDVGDLGLQE